jgi:hypothetical protein
MADEIKYLSFEEHDRGRLAIEHSLPTAMQRRG